MKPGLQCMMLSCLHKKECQITRNCLGGLDPRQREEILAQVREMPQKVETVMTETFDPTNGSDPSAVRTRQTVIRIDTFPDDVEVARGRISQGETLNKSPGTYEMARYDVAVEMPFRPSDVDAALDEMERLTAARLTAFRRRIKSGIKPGPEDGGPASSPPPGGF